MEVLLRPEARRQLQRAAAEYEEQAAGLGGQFIDDFLVTVGHLEDHAELYVEVSPGIRRAVFHRFPYLLYYSVERAHVQVLSIRAGRRRPKLPRGA